MASALVSSLRSVTVPMSRAAIFRGSLAAHKPFPMRNFATTFYAKTHEWITVDGDKATIGITDFAQDELGEIVFADLPDAGSVLDAGDTIVTLESVKAVGEVYAPLSCEVIEANSILSDEPALVNKKAESDGWLVKVKISGAPEGMMDRAAYDAHVAAEKDK